MLYYLELVTRWRTTPKMEERSEMDGTVVRLLDEKTLSTSEGRVRRLRLCYDGSHFLATVPLEGSAIPGFVREGPCHGHSSAEQDTEMNPNDLPWNIQAELRVGTITVPAGIVVVSERRDRSGNPFYIIFMQGKQISTQMLFAEGATVLRDGQSVEVRTSQDAKTRTKLGGIRTDIVSNHHGNFNVMEIDFE